MKNKKSETTLVLILLVMFILTINLNAKKRRAPLKAIIWTGIIIEWEKFPFYEIILIIH